MEGSSPPPTQGIAAEMALMLRRGREVWRLVPRRHKWALAGAVLVMVCTSACSTALALFLGQLVDGVQRGNAHGIYDGHAMQFGMEIGATRKRGADANPFACAGFGDPCGRFIFADIAFLQARDAHVLDFSFAQCVDIGRRKNAPLAEHPARRAHRMSQDRTLGVGNGAGTELHFTGDALSKLHPVSRPAKAGRPGEIRL